MSGDDCTQYQFLLRRNILQILSASLKGDINHLQSKTWIPERTRFELLSTQYAVPFSFPLELPFAIELCSRPSFVDMNVELEPDADPDLEPEVEVEPAAEIPGPRVMELDEGIGRISPGITICEVVIAALGFTDDSS